MNRKCLGIIMVVLLLSAFTGFASADGECEPVTVDLIAGQHTDSGDMVISNDNESLSVSYATQDGWKLTETHVHVACTLSGIPQTKTGNPKVGNFDYQRTYNPPVTEDTYEISLEGLNCDSVVIAAHAVVVKAVNGVIVKTETGWGEGPGFPGKNWAMYVNYDLQDCEEPECVYSMTVEKVANPTEVISGGQLDYSITVTNTGTCDLTGVIVSENIPTFSVAGVELPAFTIDSPFYGYVGNLAVGQSVILYVKATLNPLLAGRSVVVNTACADSAETENVCDTATVTVLSPPIQNDAGEDIGTPGFWCSQLGRAISCEYNPQGYCAPNQKFTFFEVNDWLNHMTLPFSRVYDELGRAYDIYDAESLICTASDRESATKLQRHLLTLWFNLVSHQVNAGMTLGELCAGPVTLPAGADLDWTVAHVMVSSESALLGGADDSTLLFWKDVVDYIDNAQAPGAGGCV